MLDLGTCWLYHSSRMRVDYGFIQHIIYCLLESDLLPFSLLLSDSFFMFIEILTRGPMLIAYLNSFF